MESAASGSPHPTPADIQIKGPIKHNTAQIDEGDSLVITTPPEQWSYAAEFPFATAQGERPGGRLVVRITARASAGVVGFGCIGDDGRHLVERHLGSLHPFEYIDLALDDGQRCKSIVARNVASTGQVSRVEVRGITAAPVEWAERRMPETFVDDSSLSRFRPWSGVTPRGYWSDWLGVRTRAEIWIFDHEDPEASNRERRESPALPTADEDVVDWIPLIDSVSASAGTFVMAELGTGWGRWLSAGAFAARQLGLDYRLYGVEAEPAHFAWTERHFRENALDPQRYTVVQAAVSDREGACWFRVGNPAEWYGQSIVPERAVDPVVSVNTALGSEIVIGDSRLRRVRCLDLRAVLRDLPIVDYMHLDIQEAEADFLGAHPDLLDQRVRMVNIGTHLAEIEDRLRRLFSRLGWRSLYDVPLGTVTRLKVGAQPAKRVEFQDGVQVWRNERQLG
ncbi:MAG: hypothetical protein ACREFN_05405 [Acetobacteraceae bacterium]